jgi:DNA mismatch endonuclease (patch repair protein)
VFALGLRYRLHQRPLPGLRRCADLVFRPAKVAVFVDGCFWHGCPRHFAPPRANGAWWRQKIGRNARRDCDTNVQLLAAGWSVLRFWEHDCPDKAARAVLVEVARRKLHPRAKPRLRHDL